MLHNHMMGEDVMLRHAVLLVQMRDISLFYLTRLKVIYALLYVLKFYPAGNFDMSKHKAKKRDWWLTPMFTNESPHGRECPPDGCI